MRKIVFVFVWLFVWSSTLAYAGNEKPIAVSQLPAAARQLIEQHFADGKVAFAKMETDLLSKSYEVIFTDGRQIEFDGKGDWTEVKCKGSAVPAALIPVAIQDYVRSNYPDEQVVKLEKDRHGYEVELSSRWELKFDQKFRLVDVDL